MFVIKTSLLVIALFVGYIQCSKKEPSDNTRVQEAIQKLNPELDQIARRLAKCKFEIHKGIFQTLTETHAAISKSGQIILQTVSELEYNASKIVEDSNNNKEVEKCLPVFRTKLERMLVSANVGVFNNSTQAFLEKYNGIVKDIDTIEKNINSLLGFCIRKVNLAWKKDELIECLFNETEYLNSMIDKFYEEIKLLNEERCALNYNGPRQENALKLIFSMQNDFFKCVQAVEAFPGEFTINASIIPEKNLTVFNATQANDSQILGRLKNMESLVNQSALTQSQIETITKRIQNLKNLLVELEHVKNSPTNNLNAPINTKEKKPFILYVSL